MNTLERLQESGAVLLGKHFVYTKGQHGPDFVHIDALLSQPKILGELCGQMVLPFLEAGIERVTACSTDRCDMLAKFCADALGVKPGLGEELRGQRTLIAEDVLTTGSSVAAIRQAAEAYGAWVVGASVIVNRGDITAQQLGVLQLEVLANVDMDAYEPNACDLCQADVPIVVDIGRGRQFMQGNPNYAGGYEYVEPRQGLFQIA